MLKTGTSTRAFTLIEVMVAASVLALGAVLIYEAFFISLDSFEYCANFLQVSVWTDALLWEAQDAVLHPSSAKPILTGGQITRRNKKFQWDLSYDVLDEIKEAGRFCQMYRIDVRVFWQQGYRTAGVSRSTYALYEKKE